MLTFTSVDLAIFGARGGHFLRASSTTERSSLANGKSATMFKKWFLSGKKQEELTVQQWPAPGPIVRTAVEQEATRTWGNSPACATLKQWLREQYQLSPHPAAEWAEQIDFLDTPSSKGFVLHLSKMKFPTQDLLHFFDHLKDRVMSLDYKTYTSDIRQVRRGPWQELVQRHYLKPRSSVSEAGLIRQRFGNITIELSARGGQWHQLRLQATGYTDRLYQEVWDFEYLLQELLGETDAR